MSDPIDLDAVATQIAFGRLVGMSQQAVSEKVMAGVLPMGGTLGQWLIRYCEDLREKAAGRGGDSDKALTKARTDEATMKAAKLRLEYMREIGSLIATDDAAHVMGQWCRQANLDYLQGIQQLVADINSRYGIKVEAALVDGIVFPTTERIKDHAEELGRRLVDSVDDLSETGHTVNG